MRTIIILSVMAISCNKNQPIFFEDDFNCQPCVSTYCVPVETGDTSQIEVALTALSGNLISNGNFASSSGWTLVGGAVISGGMVTTDNTPNQIGRDADYQLTSGYYRLTFTFVSDVVDNISGIVEVGGINTVSFSGKPFAQTVNWYFYLNNPTTNFLNIITTEGTMSLDNMSLTRMSSVAFDIKDCDTEEVLYSETDNSSVAYYLNTTTSVAFGVSGIGQYQYQNTSSYAIITLNWTELALGEGCFCICVKDGGLLGYERIKNGFFGSADFWTITNSGAKGWVIAAGVAKHEVTGGAGDDILEQELTTPLSAGSCYKLTFDVAAVAGVGDTTLDVIYLLDGSPVSSDTILLSSFPVSIERDIDFAVDTIQFVATEAGLRDISIDNVSILLDVTCLQCEENSNCISVRTDWDAFCTTRKMCNILVTGTNTNSAFGFSAGYDFVGRVFGQIRNGVGRDTETVIYDNLDGLNSLQYSDRKKVKELQIFEVPQGVHDWLELALCSQSLTLEINGVSKSFVKVAGDYAPNWRKTSANAPVIVEIMESQQTPPNARNA